MSNRNRVLDSISDNMFPSGNVPGSQRRQSPDFILVRVSKAVSP